MRFFRGRVTTQAAITYAIILKPEVKIIISGDIDLGRH